MESFGLSQDSSEYWIFESDTQNNHIVPCIAILDLGRSIKADDDFLGDYEFTFGARFYDTDSATEFKTTGKKAHDGSFTLPESDLASKYEDKDVPEDKSANVEIMEVTTFGNVKQDFVNNKGSDPANPTQPMTIKDDMRYFQKVTGGFKVYDATTDGKPRWYWNFVIETPKNLLKAGEIVYQWIAWTETTAGVEDAKRKVGAVACKTEVGNTVATEAVEWFKDNNMACSGKDVQNKKWHMQLNKDKLKKAFYQAYFWNTDNYSKKDSDRVVTIDDNGSDVEVTYETQTCEVEVVMEGDAELTDNISFSLEIGSRFYESNDAKVMDCGTEQYEDWYQPKVEYDESLNVAPAYNKDDQAPVVTTQESNDFDASLITNRNANPASNLEASSKQSGGASQSYSQGYTQFAGATESDWWWWSLSLDVPTLQSSDIVYQYLTLNTGTTNVKDAQGAVTTAKTYETVGCYIAVSDANLASNVDQYKHPTGESWSLNEKNGSNADNTNVVGKKYDAQASAIKLYDADETWTAGTARIADTVLASPSTTAGNTKYTCYFYQELKKIGRDPSKFDIDVEIQVGSRIYKSATDTAPVSTPTVSATVKKAALADYSTVKQASQTTPGTSTGAVNLAYSCFAMLVALMISMF